MTSTRPPFGPATPATPETAAPTADTTRHPREPGPPARCLISSPELAIGVTPYLLGYHPEPGCLVIHGFRDQRLVLTVATHHPLPHHPPPHDLVPHRDQPAPTDSSGADPSAWGVSRFLDRGSAPERI